MNFIAGNMQRELDQLASRPVRLLQVAVKAGELPEDRRADFLKGVFLGRPEAQANMEAMLAAHRQADSLLDFEPPASTEAYSATSLIKVELSS